MDERFEINIGVLVISVPKTSVLDPSLFKLGGLCVQGLTPPCFPTSRKYDTYSQEKNPEKSRKKKKKKRKNIKKTTTTKVIIFGDSHHYFTTDHKDSLSSDTTRYTSFIHITYKENPDPMSRQTVLMLQLLSHI